ncbi:unnamed protein product [Urochloa decumbens]|uniref:Serpin domain-containing protein n=1 Tax=Urochloa decumbens TaxID=240449 RepID=A0ABC9FR28_9POAL
MEAPSSSSNARGAGAGALTALTLRLVKQFAEAEAAAAAGKNLIFSPLSIYSLLALVAEGARGATLDELLAFLGAGSREELAALVRAAAAGSALADASRSGGPKVAFACGVWHDESRALKPAYRAAAAASYKAETRPVDFRHKPEEARKTINSWVARATNNLIDSVLEAGSVDEDTGLVLANAIYFKGKWEDPFYKDGTEVEKFYLLGGAAVDAPLMRCWGRKRIAVHAGFKVLQLPYTAAEPPRSGRTSPAARFSMCVFLPDARDGLWSLVGQVASRPGFLRDHLPTEKVAVGKLRLPKFKTSFADDKLARTLKEMGLKVTFDPSRADLSGMAEDGGSGLPLVVEEVIHKAVLEVNEEGTEAAAVSVATMRCSMSAPWKPPLEIVDFVADHPFAFFVIEEVSGAVVFAGYVLNPLL